MQPKYLILVTKGESLISNVFRHFTEADKEAGTMQKYIELKTKAGFVCHEFDYSATYQTQNNLVKLIS